MPKSIVGSNTQVSEQTVFVHDAEAVCTNTVGSEQGMRRLKGFAQLPLKSAAKEAVGFAFEGGS
jgi:hypothetical protein